MSNSITIKGTIHALMETKQVSDKFSKREFVIKTDEGKYPQDVLVQLTNDKIGQLNGYSIGDPVSVEINVRGREWRSPSGEVKYFVTLDVWKINGTAPAVSRGGSHDPAPVPSSMGGFVATGGGDDDGIPF